MALSQPAAAALGSSEPSILSVQELIKNPNITVPECFVRSNQDRPNLFNGSNNSTELPTIDLESLVSEEETDFQVEKLHAILQEWGIFQLVNHGVSFDLLEELKHELLEFYKLPIEEKMKYKMNPSDIEGYGPRTRPDGKFDWGDRFHLITNPIQRRKSHLLPEFPSNLRKTLESFIMDVQKLAMKLLGMIGKALKMPMKEMEEMFEDGMQSMRMSYYPPCPQPELVVGITPHSDPAAITILHQVNGVDGLQIKKDGIWMPVIIPQDALVVNVGDILAIMSNGIYHSVVHKVAVNSMNERISIAFFTYPKFEAEVGPANIVINPQNPPLFRRVTTEEYFKSFFSHNLNGNSYLEYMKIENGEGS